MGTCAGTGAVEILTALYSLNHGVGVTTAERQALSAAGQSLSPVPMAAHGRAAARGRWPEAASRVRFGVCLAGCPHVAGLPR